MSKFKKSDYAHHKVLQEEWKISSLINASWLTYFVQTNVEKKKFS